VRRLLPAYLIRGNQLPADRKATITLQVRSVMRMSGSDREERRVTRVLVRRWLWRRIAAIRYDWLCIFSCLSALGPFVSLRSDSETANTPADLDTQLEEILDCVWRQERIWRLERRIQASLGDRPRRKQLPPRRESTP
jgi:hypothetical protein